jgi:hypothetical protein
VNARLIPLLVVVAMASSSLAAQSESNVPNLTRQPVLDALARAYPDAVSLLPGDEPVIAVRSRNFVWAEGRLLPPELAAKWTDYAPQPFYPYPHEIPDVASWSDDQVADAESRLASRRTNAPRRSSGFFDALWGISNESDADSNQQIVRFLGLKVTVHRALVAPLGRVEARLTSLRATDPTLDAFIKGLSHLEGYNWRDIAETRSRSNHSYGAAIDIIPKNFGGQIPYWLWAPQEKTGWYRAAWAHRWQPHPAMIEAFEAEGFIWGGKWLLFDTIHFEYRPEILILNGMR